MNSRSIIFGLAFLLISSGLVIILPQSVSAATTYTWDAPGAGAASLNTNWDPVGVPINGDSVVFDSTSVYSATWDLAITLVSMTIDIGYTGTVTQTVALGVGTLVQHAGTFTGSVSNMLTCSGNVSFYDGVVTGGTVRLAMSGDDVHIFLNDTTVTLLELQVDDTTSIWLYTQGNNLGIQKLFVQTGATLIIPEVAVSTFGVRVFISDVPYNYRNYGEIVGNTTNAQFRFDVRGSTSVSPGIIDCDLGIILRSDTPGSYTTTLSGDLTTKSLELYSLNDTHTMTLDSANYSVNVGSIYVGNNAVLNLHNSTVNCSGSWVVNDGVVNYDGSTMNFTDSETAQLSTDGMWIYPSAVTHDGITYFGYITSHGDIVVQSYNQLTKVSSRYVISHFFAVNEHNAPHIFVLSDDRIMVFWSDHAGSYLYYLTSTNPHDITSWGDVNALTGDLFTYPRVVQLSSESNRIYLFYRGGSSATGDFKYRISNDNGVSWGAAVTLFDYEDDSMYVGVESDNIDNIYFAVTRSTAVGGQNHTNVTYCAYWNGAYYKADGTLIKTTAQLPILETELHMVYNSVSTGYAAFAHGVTEHNGEVAIVFVVFYSEDDYRVFYARWLTNSWSTTQVTTGVKMVYPTESFVHGSAGTCIDDADVNTFYLSKLVGDTLEIFKATTTTLGASWTLTAITTDSTSHNFRPIMSRSHSTECYLMWLSGSFDGFSLYHASVQTTPIYPAFISHSINVSKDFIFNATGRPYGVLDLDVLEVDSSIYTDMRLAINFPNGVQLSVDQATWGAEIEYQFLSYTDEISWLMESSDVFVSSFLVSGLDTEMGYRVYLDDVLIAFGYGPSFGFTATGDGEYEIVVWTSKSVSSLIVFTVNMVGVGIIVTVLASYIVPIANDIQQNRPIKPEKLTQNLIRTVIFIVVASLMWGVLHSIAIG